MNYKKYPNLLVLIYILLLINIFLINIVFIFKDFQLFKATASGWRPTNRVGITTGLFVQLSGFLFLMSYFFEKQNSVFRNIIWICKNIGSPKSQKTALITGVILIILGTMALIAGLFGYYI